MGKEGNWADILQELTPALRGAVAMEMHSGWCAQITLNALRRTPSPKASTFGQAFLDTRR